MMGFCEKKLKIEALYSKHMASPIAFLTDVALLWLARLMKLGLQKREIIMYVYV